MKQSVLGVILAGGEGRRLYPLTKQRSKSAIPFGGKFRIIDFVLSNFVNSGITSIFVLTQFKSQSLTEYLINGWNISCAQNKGRFITPVPAQMLTKNRTWYSGTADAIHQNLSLIENMAPEFVAIFGGDHIYNMDISQMISFHNKKKAVVSVAAIPVPVDQATDSIVIQVDENWKILEFQEKPAKPAPMPSDPSKVLVSMGNYIFNTPELISQLKDYTETDDRNHGFGKNVLPSMVKSGKLFAYNFHTNEIRGQSDIHPWFDIGNIKSYYYANMHLRDSSPELNLYNPDWPVYNYQSSLPPAKFIHNDSISNEGLPRIGKAINSLVSDGCVVSGSAVVDSILFNSVHIHSYSTIKSSLLLNNVEIMEHCKIQNAIIDKQVIIPPGTVIGYNREDDQQRFHVIDLDKSQNTWLSVIPKNHALKMKIPGLISQNLSKTE